jgi:ribosomal protein S27E
MAKQKTKFSSGFKKLKCKHCENIVPRVDEKTVTVICYQCTAKLVDGAVLK